MCLKPMPYIKAPSNQPALARRHRKMILFRKYFRSLESITNPCMPGLGQGFDKPACRMAGRDGGQVEPLQVCTEGAICSLLLFY